MTPKEKAKQLIEKFEPYVYPYRGSSMLTNTQSDSVILENSKICAAFTVDELITELSLKRNSTEYWIEVKKEIENFK